MKSPKKVGSAAIIIALTALFLSACNFTFLDNGAISDWLKRITPTVVEPTIQALLTPETSQSPESEAEPCGYMWATQPLPEVTEALQRYFNDAGFLDAKVTAEAFGENCVRADGSVERFLTMYTDVRVTLPVLRLADTGVLAERAEAVLRLVLDYPAELLPGSLEGYLGITFTDPQGQTENLWFKRLAGKEALDKGLTGEELLIFLRGN